MIFMKSAALLLSSFVVSLTASFGNPIQLFISRKDAKEQSREESTGLASYLTLRLCVKKLFKLTL